MRFHFKSLISRFPHNNQLAVVPSDRTAGKGKLAGCKLATTRVTLESMILRPGRFTITPKYDLQQA